MEQEGRPSGHTLTVIAPYTIIALMVSISREMANPTQAFSVWGKNREMA